MISIYDYKDKCWWCSLTADSREHRFKRTDIVREFGRGPFCKGEIVKTEGNFDIKNGLSIQSPKSDCLKFSKNICQKCNNERSQPFDRSYDTFMKYIKHNEQLIFDSHKINLEAVFGVSWIEDYKNLTRYFVKNISTRFAELGIKIENEIIQFLEEQGDLKFYKLVFQIRTDWVEFYKYLKRNNKEYGYVHASGIEGGQSKAFGSYYWLSGTLQYRWFQVTYYYDNILLNFPTDNLKTEILLLEEDYSIIPDELKERIKKAR